jgi:hypothetical protein
MFQHTDVVCVGGDDEDSIYHAVSAVVYSVDALIHPRTPGGTPMNKYALFLGSVNSLFVAAW